MDDSLPANGVFVFVSQQDFNNLMFDIELLCKHLFETENWKPHSMAERLKATIKLLEVKYD